MKLIEDLKKENENLSEIEVCRDVQDECNRSHNGSLRSFSFGYLKDKLKEWETKRSTYTQGLMNFIKQC